MDLTICLLAAAATSVWHGRGRQLSIYPPLLTRRVCSSSALPSRIGCASDLPMRCDTYKTRGACWSAFECMQGGRTRRAVARRGASKDKGASKAEAGFRRARRAYKGKQPDASFFLPLPHHRLIAPTQLSQSTHTQRFHLHTLPSPFTPLSTHATQRTHAYLPPHSLFARRRHHVSHQRRQPVYAFEEGSRFTRRH